MDRQIMISKEITKKFKILVKDYKKRTKLKATEAIRRDIDNIQKIKELTRLKKFLQLVRYAEKENKLIPFNILKYREQTYKVDQDVMISTEDIDEVCLGRIKGIVGVQYFKSYIPLVIVNWYYRREDIKQKCQFFSERELFLSNHEEVIQVETLIKELPEIIAFEKYDTLSEVEENVFFTRQIKKKKFEQRAQYNTLTQQLTPPTHQWQKHCICQLPLNPDQFYILCSLCNIWYHPQCSGVTEKFARSLKTYQCQKCLEGNKK